VSEEDHVAKSWQMPLLHFTSKRRGSQKDDRQLARSVRYAVDILCEGFFFLFSTRSLLSPCVLSLFRKTRTTTATATVPLVIFNQPVFMEINLH